jgi:hypothetical protein
MTLAHGAIAAAALALVWNDDGTSIPLPLAHLVDLRPLCPGEVLPKTNEYGRRPDLRLARGLVSSLLG